MVLTLRRALEADPQRYDARLNLARVLERQGQAAEAAREYALLAKRSDASTRLQAIARERLARLRPAR